MASEWLNRYLEHDFCYVTTTGRRSGLPRTIEIWFAGHGHQLYLLSEHRERAAWVLNIMADSLVTVRLGEETRTGRGRIVTDPDEALLARQLIAAKYHGWKAGESLTGWVTEALPVALELETNDGPSGES